MDAGTQCGIGGVKGIVQVDLTLQLSQLTLALYFLATCITCYTGWRASMSIDTMPNDGSAMSGPWDVLDQFN